MTKKSRWKAKWLTKMWEKGPKAWDLQRESLGLLSKEKLDALYDDGLNSGDCLVDVPGLGRIDYALVGQAIAEKMLQGKVHSKMK